jgi:plastocyanin
LNDAAASGYRDGPLENGATMSDRLAAIASASLALVLAVACSESSTPNEDGTSSGDSGTSGSSGSSGTDGGGGSSGDAESIPAVNGCTSYKDETNAQDVVVTWDFPITTSDSRCIKVKVGTTVTFQGDFTTHPLMAQGGDSPNPLSSNADRITNPGTAEERASTKFASAGVFGFWCAIHPAMTGAILVVP